MNTEEQTEEHLVEAARRGSRDAFGRLVQRHARQVFRVCYRVAGTESMAEDAVQETFIKAWRKLGGFDGRSAFTTWLHRIAVNAALEQLRRESRHRADPVPDDGETAAVHWTDSSPSPERLTESDGVSRRMSGALEELSTLERTAFVLRHYQELPIIEICETLGMQPSAAKQAIFRAVKKMRIALHDYGNEGGVNKCSP